MEGTIVNWADAILKKRGIDANEPGFKAYLPTDRTKYSFDLVLGNAGLSQGLFLTKGEAEAKIAKFRNWIL